MKKYFLPLIFISFCSVRNLHAQAEPGIADILSDIQRIDQQDNRNLYLYYFPMEYFEISLRNDPSITPEIMDYLKYLLGDYVIFLEGNVKLSNDGTGNVDSKDYGDLMKNTKLKDKNGVVYSPLKANEISQETLSLLERLTPLFAKTFGKFGNGFKLILFKVQDKSGHNLIHPKENTPFTVIFYDKEFYFDLPFAVYLPPRFCPVDHAELSGKWNYCPIHGNKLE